jgi:hypothetical protein
LGGGTRERTESAARFLVAVQQRVGKCTRAARRDFVALCDHVARIRRNRCVGGGSGGLRCGASRTGGRQHAEEAAAGEPVRRKLGRRAHGGDLVPTGNDTDILPTTVLPCKALTLLRAAHPQIATTTTKKAGLFSPAFLD